MSGVVLNIIKITSTHDKKNHSSWGVNINTNYKLHTRYQNFRTHKTLSIFTDAASSTDIINLQMFDPFALLCNFCQFFLHFLAFLKLFNNLCHMSQVISSVRTHVSHVTHLVSCVTCHMLPVTCPVDNRPSTDLLNHRKCRRKVKRKVAEK